jgi:hypothetical protein
MMESSQPAIFVNLEDFVDFVKTPLPHQLPQLEREISHKFTKSKKALAASHHRASKAISHLFQTFHQRIKDFLWDGENLWVADFAADRVRRVAPNTGALLQSNSVWTPD